MIERATPLGHLELARSAANPRISPAGLRDRFGDTHDHTIAPGQIWRASWDDVSVLALVVEFDQTDIDVIPLTIDPEGEDSDCLVLDAGLSAFGCDATLWVGLRTTLPMRVFDEIIDELGEEILQSLLDPETIDKLSLDGVRHGHAHNNPFNTATQFRAEIEDDLAALRSSPALPVASDPSPLDRPTLAALLGKELDLSVLVEALRPLGLTQADVMRLLKGRRPVTPAIALAVADATGVDVTQVKQSVQPLPPRFVREVAHPRWRPVWRERADSSGVDEADARLEMSYEMFALAARQTGAQEPDWHARLAQFLASRGNRRMP
ncbi:hypothetical protein [Mycolicibacterium fortuitum]|uniref:hypothetical protein n=1 Tax=Mycolicibacterium fortuitum TaxID=1766 RepID=UPI000A8ECA68|nr:hypothetical protein [Mycolicibacterium fortuitum]